MPAIIPTISPMTYYLGATQENASPQAQSIVGQQLLVMELEARLHWSDRTEVFMSEKINSDLLQYTPIPPKRTFYVSTMYVHGGRGTPLPFELEDE